LNALKKVIKDESRITIVVVRNDPDASDSSASSVDYDSLAAIGVDGKAMVDEIEEQDDDTIPYDGHECRCVWCPDCQP
jgi:hypothetical protein